MGTRRINVTKVPFNFQWPGTRHMSVIRELGEALVKDEVADAAVAKGYAKEMDPAPKAAKAAPRKKATPAKKPAKPKADAATANPGPSDRVDRDDLAPADSADGEPPVADAG